MAYINLTLLLLVATGSAIGGALRYLCYGMVLTMIDRLFHDNSHHAQYGIIYSTFFVNIIGGIIIGISFTLLPVKFGNPHHAFLMAGLLGGFTTFSAFSLEIYQLLSKQDYLPAFYYSLASILLAVTGVALGVLVGRIVAG
ncbi:MAG: CrcB family protein [Alphaproteobacteria bacterium]|nr:CrcB family protein [Alphaproteobacteria bacterium]